MGQTEHVLCAVDFSEPARHALDYAIALARWHGAAVTALYVHRMTVPALSVGPYMAADAVQPILLSDDERAHLKGALDRFVASDRGAGVAISTRVEEDFDVAGAIVAYARALPAAEIVIGTHGRTGLPRWLVGSVAERVVRTAECPVVTVPPHAADAVPMNERGVHRIVCSVDFSEASNRALDRAIALAVEAQGELTVVHAVDLLPELPDMPMPDFESYRERRIDEGRRQLASSCETASARCAATARLLEGSPYKAIVALAAEMPADLIVMGVHGRSAVDIAFLGSTVQQVVRHAPCPVMTIRG